MVDPTFYQKVVSAFNKYHVEFLVLGGFAVNHYGFTRSTLDLDLWVHPTTQNMDKVYHALLSMDYDKAMVDRIWQERSLEDPNPIKIKDDSETFRVDIMTQIYQTQFEFEECYQNGVQANLFNNQVYLIDLDRLITIKKNTSRLQDNMKDLIDATRLEDIKERLNNAGKNKGRNENK